MQLLKMVQLLKMQLLKPVDEEPSSMLGVAPPEATEEEDEVTCEATEVEDGLTGATEVAVHQEDLGLLAGQEMDRRELTREAIWNYKANWLQRWLQRWRVTPLQKKGAGLARIDRAIIVELLW